MNKEQQRQRIGTDLSELRKQRGMTQQQVADIVHEVMTDTSNRRVTVLSDAELKKIKSPKK